MIRPSALLLLLRRSHAQETSSSSRLLPKKKYSVDEDERVSAVSLASNFEKGYKQYLEIERNGYGFKEVRKGIYGHEDDHRRYYWIDLGIIGREAPEKYG